MIRKLAVCMGVSLIVAAQLVITASPAAAKCHDANFIPSEYVASEDDGGVRVRVMLGNGDRSSPGTEACTGSVEYSTEDGTAKAGEDYVYKSGRLVFHAWDHHEHWFTVDLINADPIEPEETFALRLSGCAGSVMVCNSRASVTIRADDPRSASPATKPIRSEQSGTPVTRSPVPPSASPSAGLEGSVPGTSSENAAPAAPAVSPPSGPHSLIGGRAEEPRSKAPWVLAAVLVPAVLFGAGLRIRKRSTGT